MTEIQWALAGFLVVQLYLLRRLLTVVADARKAHEASQIAIHKVLVLLYEAQPGRVRLPPDVPRPEYRPDMDPTPFRRP